MFKHDMSIVVRSEGTVNIQSVFAGSAKSALVPTCAISDRYIMPPHLFVQGDRNRHSTKLK